MDDAASVFQIGEHVQYWVPVIESPLKYHWTEHVGVIRSVDRRFERITVAPKDESIGWRIVAMVYIKRGVKAGGIY